jgi:ABC-type Mn2+/Zn2+ transport system permease subunit
MKRNYAIGIAVFVLLAAAVVYIQYMAPGSGEAGLVGNVISSPAQSATTFTGLIIVFVLVWFTFGREGEQH